MRLRVAPFNFAFQFRSDVNLVLPASPSTLLAPHVHFGVAGVLLLHLVPDTSLIQFPVVSCGFTVLDF